MIAIVQRADSVTIATAADILLAGELVVMPTETVYGLAGDATNPRAIASIYAAKGRPRFNPLISHVPSLAEARRHGVFSPMALRLAEAFWPGPLTLVLERRADSSIAELACAGLSSVALRVPSHPVTQALLDRVGRPLAAPSANRSGRLSPTRAEHAAEDLAGAVGMVLDAGPCVVGLESSVVAISPGDEATLLRPGALTRESLEAVAGPLHSAPDGAAPVAPGMLSSHYAPRATLRLRAQTRESDEAFLAFDSIGPDDALNLSRSGDLVEAAANLFVHLRTLDATGVARIAVAPIPESGLGEAINDRLFRAAAGR